MDIIWYAILAICFENTLCRDEEKIMKSCYWPNEVYEPCFGGCAEVSCDNPRNHLRPCYPYCEPGCVCEEPYVRDDRTHQCVLPQDCSPTQMGIPVATKRPARPTTSQPKYSNSYMNRAVRNHSRRDSIPQGLEYSDVEGTGTNHLEDGKRLLDNSRMGNYFNIVIAPPPIKQLQPRKLMHGNFESRSGGKRIVS